MPTSPDQPAHGISPSDIPEVVARTQRYDIARSIPLGFLFPLQQAVFLTVAIQHFDAPGFAKGLIAAGTGIGLLTSTWLTFLARRSRFSAMTVASMNIMCGAIALGLGATGSLWLFVIGAVVGQATLTMNIPLVTATYERNYPATERGRRVGRGMVVKVGIAAPSALLMGMWLTRRPDDWWLVIALASFAAAALSVLNRKIPSAPLPRTDRRHPWPQFNMLREDRNLRVLITAWMFMGFGNLMLMPLRVEYLAQEQYGIAATATVITVVTVAIPSVVRLVLTPIFGRIFDKAPVYVARITLNLIFVLYVLTFFSTSSMVMIVLGSVLLGVAFSGGDIMWNLWVTKFATPDRVADYMGIHAFFTGVRAVIAPLVGYLVIARLSLPVLAILGAGLMVVSCLILLPRAIHYGWRPTTAPTS